MGPVFLQAELGRLQNTSNGSSLVLCGYQYESARVRQEKTERRKDGEKQLTGRQCQARSRDKNLLARIPSARF